MEEVFFPQVEIYAPNHNTELPWAQKRENFAGEKGNKYRQPSTNVEKNVIAG